MNHTYAVIKSSLVINVIVADPGFINAYHPTAVRIDQLSPVPGIGWTYNGTNFFPPS